MQARGETDADACSYNDFALVEVRLQDQIVLIVQIDPADYARVNPVRLRPIAVLARIL